MTGPSELSDRRAAAAEGPTRRSDQPILVSGRRGRGARLTVACVLDNFSAHCFGPEAAFAPLTPENWELELLAAQPDLLLVESAWRGHRNTWWNRVHRAGPEVLGIVQWCRSRSIPTAFWNKEDPVHFTTFVHVASLFDVVYTTDVDCVARYKQQLGHDRVHLLPFAAQPEVHNPFATFERIDGCAFAGAYYERYPERARDLRNLADEFIARGRFDIYDRNFGQDAPGYRFPDEYRPYIVGTLRPDEIDVAYKGYTANLNLNSVQESQSMFARRVFELVASNTLVVSNFAHGLRVMFGDLTLTTGDRATLSRRLRWLDDQPNGRERLLAAGLRKVLAEHTYAHRLEYIAETAGLPLPPPDPERPMLVARVSSADEARSAIANLRRQSHHGWVLVLLIEGSELPGLEGQPPGVYLAADWAAATELGRQHQCTHVGGIEPHSYYGPNYLHDLLSGSRLLDDRVVGFGEFFAVAGGHLERREGGAAFRRCGQLEFGRSLARVDGWNELPWLIDGTDRAAPRPEPGIALGTVGYCEGGHALTPDELAPVLELDVDRGRSLDDLQRHARASAGAVSDRQRHPEEVVSIFAGIPTDDPDIEVTRHEGGTLGIISTLPIGKHKYLWSEHRHGLDVLPANVDGTAYFECVSGGAQLMLVFIYYDAIGDRVGESFLRELVNTNLEWPSTTVSVQVGLRVMNPGASTQLRYFAGPVHHPTPPVLLRSETVVLTPCYPSYQDLYRCAFIHSRLRGYLDLGVRTAVYQHRERPVIGYWEFEDIDVAEGGADPLRRLLESGRVRNLLVHFLSPARWEVLRSLSDPPRIIVWIHGAEIQPWWRRTFNYTTSAELDAAIEDSAIRVAMWREVFSANLPDVHFVFVSQAFADEVFDDIEVTLDPSRYSIIHNPIDTDIFQYQEKTPEHAKRILSIRPYASRKYANDLSVRAVLELTQRSGFDELDFCFVGAGTLFDEVVAPLRGIPNVTLRNEFLTQHEIAALHRDFGILLSPSRADSQGVSRDEAMASGLVPVTTHLPAIAEFVPPSCGMLTEPEDYVGLADAMWALAHEPERFRQMSRSAADQVRLKTAGDITVPQELKLFTTDLSKR